MTFRNLPYFLLGMSLCTSGLAAPWDEQAGDLNTLMDEARPLVENAPDGFFVSAPLNSNLIVMNVRVFTEKGSLVLSERSQGEPVALFAADLPDGNYRYETVAVFQIESGDGRTGPAARNEATSREFGEFRISNGSLSQPRPNPPRNRTSRDEASLWDRIGRGAIGIVSWTLDALVPTAQAADLTASSGFPFVDFDDDDNGAGTDWRLNFQGNASSTNGTFGIVDTYGSNGSYVVAIYSSGSGNSTFNSLVVDADGDLHWAGQLMNLDRGLGELSIGTSQALAGITLFHSTPDLLFHDETGTQEALYELSNDTATFWAREHDAAAWDGIFSFDVHAPTDSLKITDTGTVALNGGNAIHVGDTADPVGQFAITENGIVRFEMIRTDLGNRWRFTNAGDKFAINNVDADSPDTDFNMFKTGDLVIAGALTQNSDRNAKQDIVAVDRNDVLARIARLPIAEWSYKDTPDQRHIGPMAQDFHAAFGLGMNDKGISSLDTGGVALAGIQALAEENEHLTRKVSTLEGELVELKQQQHALLQMMNAVLAGEAAEVRTTMN